MRTSTAAAPWPSARGRKRGATSTESRAFSKRGARAGRIPVALAALLALTVLVPAPPLHASTAPRTFAAPFAATTTVATPPAGPVQPASWAQLQPAPKLAAWPNAVRLWGPDHHSTALAAALTARGTGGLPYASPHAVAAAPATQGAPPTTSLALSSNWWGLGTCPRSIIIAASDVAADALAATSLSDPTGNSSEPLLTRTATANPFLAPLDEAVRVDTDSAPILLTASARTGATGLSPPAALGAADLRSGGCTEAHQAVIVGGPAAVPPGVEAELLAVGYDEVFRVAGPHRYATAGAVATALGTQPLPRRVGLPQSPVANCELINRRLPASGSTASFYVNAAIEWHDSATECQVLSETVLLADGVEGIDAIAVAPFTSFWQVPVLLHDGTPDAREETVDLLLRLQPKHVVVVGGHQRISDRVVGQVEAVTGAETLRLAGDNRYATAVAIAQHLGGWWPAATGRSYSNAVLCVAPGETPTGASAGEATTGASAGDEANAAHTTGHWQAALTAGPLCASMFAASHSSPGAPDVPPTGSPAPERARELNSQGSTQPLTIQPSVSAQSPRAVPLLLTSSSPQLAPELADFLQSTFDSTPTRPCVQPGLPLGCANPGFAVVVGAPASLPDSAVNQLSAALGRTPSPSGRPGQPAAPDPPTAAITRAPFVTQLNMTPAFASFTTDGQRQPNQFAPRLGDPAQVDLHAQQPSVCWDRGTYSNTRWLTASSPAATPLGAVDALAAGLYSGPDPNQGAFITANTEAVAAGAQPTGVPVCLAVQPEASVEPQVTTFWSRAVSSTGRASAASLHDWRPAQRVSLSGPQLLSRQVNEDNATGADEPATDEGTLKLTFWGAVRGSPSESNAPPGIARPPGEPLEIPVTTALETPQFRSVVASVVVEIELLPPPTSAATNQQATANNLPAEGGPTRTFVARWALNTRQGSLAGEATGEAVPANRSWHLRGRTNLTASSFGRGEGTGGFAANLRGDRRGTFSLVWRFDALTQPQPQPATER